MIRSAKRALLAGLLLALAGPARPAAAQEDDAPGGELFSVEKRALLGSHEMNASFGVLPLNAFAKGISLYGGYTYHFSELVGWEILGGMYSFNVDTGFKSELKRRFDTKPSVIGQSALGELDWILNSNFLFKPLHGKFVLLNDVELTGEMFFVLGYAMGGYAAGLPSGFDAGVGLRMFIGQYFSVRLDIRDYVFLPDAESALHISLGLSLTFGFDDDEEDED